MDRRTDTRLHVHTHICTVLTHSYPIHRYVYACLAQLEVGDEEGRKMERREDAKEEGRGGKKAGRREDGKGRKAGGGEEEGREGRKAGKQEGREAGRQGGREARRWEGRKAERRGSGGCRSETRRHRP